VPPLVASQVSITKRTNSSSLLNIYGLASLESKFIQTFCSVAYLVYSGISSTPKRLRAKKCRPPHQDKSRLGDGTFITIPISLFSQGDVIALFSLSDGGAVITLPNLFLGSNHSKTKLCFLRAIERTFTS